MLLLVAAAGCYGCLLLRRHSLRRGRTLCRAADNGAGADGAHLLQEVVVPEAGGAMLKLDVDLGGIQRLALECVEVLLAL